MLLINGIMAGVFTRSDKRFSIDDAFEEENDEAIKVYGSTTERSPLKPKNRSFTSDDSLVNQINDPNHLSQSLRITFADDMKQVYMVFKEINSIEMMFMKVQLESEIAYLAACYRPPHNNFNECNVELENILSSELIMNEETLIIAGDMNLCYLSNAYGANRCIDTYSYETLSRDSDSLIHEGGYRTGFDPSQPCWRHPKIRENWKMVLAAVNLLIVGVGLLLTSFLVLFMSDTRLQGFVFFVAGSICFIPGAYHVVYIYLAVKGRRGYDFYHLPLFN